MPAAGVFSSVDLLSVGSFVLHMSQWIRRLEPAPPFLETRPRVSHTVGSDFTSSASQIDDHLFLL